MKHLRFLAASLLAVLLVPISFAPVSSLSAAPQAKNEKKEVLVWVNTASGVYHCPGTRWYGKTKKGKYVSECDATKDGNRPAYGKACGSNCK